jgi:hypothetical protein
MVMLPYSIVSSLDYYRKLYQPNKYVLKDNLQVSHTVGSAQAVMRAALKNLAYQRTQQYIPYGTVCHSFVRKWTDIRYIQSFRSCQY